MSYAFDIFVYPLTAVSSGHTNEINQIKCNPSGTRLASCSDDQTARVWNLADLSGSRTPDSDPIPGLSESNRVVQLDGHDHSVSSISWCPQSSAGGVELIATSVTCRSALLHRQLILTIFRASFDATARLWDSVTGECLKTFADHKRPVYALTFSPDGHWLGTGSGDGWLHIYSVKVHMLSSRKHIES